MSDSNISDSNREGDTAIGGMGPGPFSNRLLSSEQLCLNLRTLDSYLSGIVSSRPTEMLQDEAGGYK